MAQEQYTFKDFLVKPTLLYKVSEETWGSIQFSKSLSSIQLWWISTNVLAQQITNKEGGTKLSGMEIHHLVFLFTTLPLQTGAECHFGVATVWCHPNQSKISVWAAYKMLENHNVSMVLLMVLRHAYNDIKYSPHPFPATIAIAVADNTKLDIYATALSDLTAWPLLSVKDGKVICLKELVGHNHFKCFGMLGKDLWQVKPNGPAPPLTEYLQLSPASKASTEEGMNITNAPLLEDKAKSRKKKHR